MPVNSPWVEAVSTNDSSRETLWGGRFPPPPEDSGLGNECRGSYDAVQRRRSREVVKATTCGYVSA